MSKPSKRNYLLGVNRILTPQGYKQIQDLKVGDMLEVYDHIAKKYYSAPLLSIRRKFIPPQFFYKIKLNDDFPTEVVATLYTFLLDNQFKQHSLHSLGALRLMYQKNMGAGIDYTHKILESPADDLMSMIVFTERDYSMNVNHDGILCYYLEVPNDPYLVVDSIFLRLGVKIMPVEKINSENVESNNETTEDVYTPTTNKIQTLVPVCVKDTTQYIVNKPPTKISDLLVPINDPPVVAVVPVTMPTTKATTATKAPAKRPVRGKATASVVKKSTASVESTSTVSVESTSTTSVESTSTTSVEPVSTVSVEPVSTVPVETSSTVSVETSSTVPVEPTSTAHVELITTAHVELITTAPVEPTSTAPVESTTTENTVSTSTTPIKSTRGGRRTPATKTTTAKKTSTTTTKTSTTTSRGGRGKK